MKGNIKIEFRELSKSVSAEARIEIELDTEECSLENIKLYKEEVLLMSKELMDKALAYSKLKTMEKM